MAELQEALGALANEVGGVRAALVVEATGIPVAAWGEVEEDHLAAELADLWARAGAPGLCTGTGQPRAVEFSGAGGAWVAVQLGDEYLLALLTGQGVPSGRVRFLAGEWAAARRKEFA